MVLVLATDMERDPLLEHRKAKKKELQRGKALDPHWEKWKDLKSVYWSAKRWVHLKAKEMVMLWALESAR